MRSVVLSCHVSYFCFPSVYPFLPSCRAYIFAFLPLQTPPVFPLCLFSSGSPISEHWSGRAFPSFHHHLLISLCTHPSHITATMAHNYPPDLLWLL